MRNASSGNLCFLSNVKIPFSPDKTVAMQHQRYSPAAASLAVRLVTGSVES